MKKKIPPLVIVIVAIVAFAAAIAGGYLLRMILNSGEEAQSSFITKIESEDDDKEKEDVDVSLQYAGRATLFTDEKIINLNFANPSKSKKSLSLEISVNVDGEDIVLAETNKIRPGYKINNVEYTLEREIPKGDYKGKFIVHFYNEQDKEEVVNSEIAINIYVK